MDREFFFQVVDSEYMKIFIRTGDLVPSIYMREQHYRDKGGTKALYAHKYLRGGVTYVVSDPRLYTLLV